MEFIIHNTNTQKMKFRIINKNSIAIHLLIIISLITGIELKAQDETIGLRYYDQNTSEGYILFTPKKNSAVYLINNCGELINEWTFTEKPGATCYLLNDGSLLRAGKDSLEIRDWESNLVWSYATAANDIAQHHDIEPLPNGNILCVVTETYTQDEIVALGRSIENTGDSFKIDKLIEIEPSGNHDANIVWEWRFIDHLIQDIDPDKPNYGVVIEHPELVDLNYINSSATDFTHVNAVDYNADLDQIMVSPRHLNEIMIIDHSTTTVEAIGHIGGNSGVGGDIMWRWGNPAGYKQGTEEDQKLFLQHDCKWVENGYLDEGKISVFNNGGDLTNMYSSVHLIEPTFTSGAYLKETNTFLPNDYEWTWNGLILGDTMQEPSQSGAMSLSNGNFIICETSKGQFSEITKTGDLLMTYVNPTGSTIYDQYSVIENKDNAMFRAEKYPIDFPGFQGKDMTPKGIIEDINTNSDLCSLLQVNDEIDKLAIQINNPITDNRIQFNHYISNADIIISDLNGRVVFQAYGYSGNSLSVNLSPSLYLLQIKNGNDNQVVKIIIQ